MSRYFDDLEKGIFASLEDRVKSLEANVNTLEIQKESLQETNDELRTLVRDLVRENGKTKKVDPDILEKIKEFEEVEKEFSQAMDRFYEERRKNDKLQSAYEDLLIQNGILRDQLSEEKSEKPEWQQTDSFCRPSSEIKTASYDVSPMKFASNEASPFHANGKYPYSCY
jgi:intergrase/recombinase